MHSSRWILLIASFLAVPASSVFADDWTKTYTVSSHPELELITDDGNVRIETWNRAAIGVHVITRGLRIAPNGVRIAEHRTGNHLQLEVRMPRWEFSFGFKSRSLRIEVSLPREADLDIQTGDGGVTVSPVTGTAHIHTGDGGISVEGLKGDILLESGDGGIEGRGLDGNLRVRTGDGGVHVQGRFDELHLHSGDGGVDAEASAGSRIRDEWNVTTGDGHVTLRVPADLRADVDVRTGDGRIDVDLPLEISGYFGHSKVRGKLNGGGPPLVLRSGDGSIRIERD